MTHPKNHTSEVKKGPKNMKDRFFDQKYCDRCGKELHVRIMSMYNTDCIYLDCKKKETARDDYAAARDADNEAIKNGNYNFKGIGLS